MPQASPCPKTLSPSAKESPTSNAKTSRKASSRSGYITGLPSGQNVQTSGKSWSTAQPHMGPRLCMAIHSFESDVNNGAKVAKSLQDSIGSASPKSSGLSGKVIDDPSMHSWHGSTNVFDGAGDEVGAADTVGFNVGTTVLVLVLLPIVLFPPLTGPSVPSFKLGQPHCSATSVRIDSQTAASSVLSCGE